MGKKKKTKEVFPPAQQPRKEDLLLESGEYFLNEQERKRVARREEQASKSAQKRQERTKEFEPPVAKNLKKRKAEAGMDASAGDNSSGVARANESATEMAQRLRDKALMN